MNFTEEILNMTNNHKKNKIDKFVQTVRQMKLEDIDGTAKLYSRDKGKADIVRNNEKIYDVIIETIQEGRNK